MNALEQNGSMNIDNLSLSLRKAFDDYMQIYVAENEMYIKIGPKAAWINSSGFLTGESLDGI